MLFMSGANTSGVRYRAISVRLKHKRKPLEVPCWQDIINQIRVGWMRCQGECAVSVCVGGGRGALVGGWVGGMVFWLKCVRICGD